MEHPANPAPDTTLPGPTTPDEVDEASAESFPASDSPSWDPLHPGSPVSPPPDEQRRAGAGD